MDQPPSHALIVQFLTYLAAAPRRYDEVMEGWRSSCPRLSIWEDAVLDGLVRIEGQGPRTGALVLPTDKGLALLARQLGPVAVAPPRATRRRRDPAVRESGVAR